MTTQPPTKTASLHGDPIDFSALTEISIIAHLAENAFARVLPKGLTTAQFGVLNHLLRKGQPETIGDIAAAMQVSQPTMSSTVRKLENQGFVNLIATDADRRVRRVAVTEAGQIVRDKSIEKIAVIRHSMLAEISDTDWALILPTLSRIRSALDQAR